MDLLFHGGLCCGIKTIYSLGTDPDALCVSLEKIAVDDRDQYGYHVSSADRFFHKAAPEETKKERLKRYIEYCHERRPQGMIEVTTAIDPYDKWLSQGLWEPILLELGFKLVTEFKNSNSGNTVKVWHNVYDFGPDEDECDEYECVDPDCPCHSKEEEVS